MNTSICMCLSIQYIQVTSVEMFNSVFFLQNGNWADRSCDEKHGFICMKQSATEETGDEVDVDIGCKAVSTCSCNLWNKYISNNWFNITFSSRSAKHLSHVDPDTADKWLVNENGYVAFYNHNSSVLIRARFPTGVEKTWLLLLLCRNGDKDIWWS